MLIFELSTECVLKTFSFDVKLKQRRKFEVLVLSVSFIIISSLICWIFSLLINSKAMLGLTFVCSLDYLFNFLITNSIWIPTANIEWLNRMPWISWPIYVFLLCAWVTIHYITHSRYSVSNLFLFNSFIVFYYNYFIKIQLCTFYLAFLLYIYIYIYSI